MPDLDALATLGRDVIDRSAYMTLATANGSGRPWVSPVWFACEDHRTLWWVSMPDAVHSRNVAARPVVAIVVHDTAAAVGEAQAVYARAVAAQVDDPEGIEVFSRASVAAGLRAWSMEDVTAKGGLRLYRAIAVEFSVLDAASGNGHDERFVVEF